MKALDPSQLVWVAAPHNCYGRVNSPLFTHKGDTYVWVFVYAGFYRRERRMITARIEQVTAMQTPAEFEE